MGLLYLGVYVCATDLGQVTDVGLETFLAAVKANRNITTMTLEGMFQFCRAYLSLVDEFTRDYSLGYNFLACLSLYMFSNIIPLDRSQQHVQCSEGRYP